MRRQPSLRSQLNQIRLWVRQGRTDAWIAHKLDVSIDQLERFKRDHDLLGEGAAPGRPADPLSVPPPEIDLYEEEEEEEEEEELEEEQELEDEEEQVGALVEEPAKERQRGRAGERAPRRERAEAGDDTAPPRRRRRGRRGGRGRRRPSAYEATFDHGEEGYGLWLDPAVVDNPVYAQHWAGSRAVVVTFDRDAITIRRANAAQEEPESETSEPGDDR